MLNTEVAMPIATASVRMAVVANAGVRNRERAEILRSCQVIEAPPSRCSLLYSQFDDPPIFLTRCIGACLSRTSGCCRTHRKKHPGAEMASHAHQSRESNATDHGVPARCRAGLEAIGRHSLGIFRQCDRRREPLYFGAGRVPELGGDGSSSRKGGG